MIDVSFWPFSGLKSAEHIFRVKLEAGGTTQWKDSELILIRLQQGQLRPLLNAASCLHSLFYKALDQCDFNVQ